MIEASPPDLLRLLALPAFVWAAVRDVRTRRVSNRIWPPLAALGVLALGSEAWSLAGGPAYLWRPFALRVAISLGLVVPLAYGFWRIGGFGGADAKAFMVLALLFPTYPRYAIPGVGTLPVVETALGVLSLSILTNTVVLAASYPVALAVANLAAGRRSLAAFVGRPIDVDALPTTHGRLLEDPEGFTRRGLDLDALRMYLRWRRLDLDALRGEPALRDPATLPDRPADPTDGAVVDGSAADAAERRPDPPVGDAADDPWGAAAFLAAVDGNAYGTTPDRLRDGLAVLADPDRDAVWISPGLPFLVPLLAGLVLALTYGDLLFAALRALGLV